MKKIFIIPVALLCVFLSGRAGATDTHTQKNDKPPTAIKKLEVNPAFCAQMATYHEPAGVEYQPGVDVHGKPVVPADLNPSPIKPDIKSFSFPLTIDLAEYLGIDHPAGLEGKMGIGTIGYENGHVTFNGVPVDGKAEAAMDALCQQQAQQPKESVKTQTTAKTPASP